MSTFKGVIFRIYSFSQCILCYFVKDNYVLPYKNISQIVSVVDRVVGILFYKNLKKKYSY